MNWPASSTPSTAPGLVTRGRAMSGLVRIVTQQRCVPTRPGGECPLILVLPLPGTHVVGAGRSTGDRDRRQLSEGTPQRARVLPAQPPRTGETPRCRVGPGPAAAHTGPAPRGGRATSRRGRHLVHVARAGAADQCQRPGARRHRPRVQTRPGRALASIPAGGRAGRADRRQRRRGGAAAGRGAGRARLSRPHCGVRLQRPVRPAGLQRDLRRALSHPRLRHRPRAQCPVADLHHAQVPAAQRRRAPAHGGRPQSQLRQARRRAAVDRLRRGPLRGKKFAELWATHQVAVPMPEIKWFQADDGTTIDMRTSGFHVDGMPEARLLVYMPATSADAAKIGRASCRERV